MAIVEKNVKKTAFFSRNPWYLLGTFLFITAWFFPFLGKAPDNFLLEETSKYPALYLHQFLLAIPQYFEAIELRGHLFATIAEFVVLSFNTYCILIALITGLFTFLFSNKNQHSTALWFSFTATLTSLSYLFLCLEYYETPFLVYRSFGIGYIFFLCGNIMFLKGNQFAKKKAPKTEQSLKEIYLQFAQIISSNDNAVLAQVRDLFEHTAVFLATHQERYDERGIDTEQISKEKLYWISFADILIAHNYAADFDWKCELEDFEYFLKNLQKFKSYPTIDFPDLDTNESIDLWIEQINTYWEHQPITLMLLDIDSDSYVVFPINKEYISFLKTKSQKLGQKFY